MTPPSTEVYQSIEANDNDEIWGMTFSANGEHLVCGGPGDLEAWRVEDAKRVATVQVDGVVSLAVSNDGKWMAAGTCKAEVFVWDTRTHKRILKRAGSWANIFGVDFSPDSAKLVAASGEGTATIWNVITRKQVQTLHHGDRVISAKFSPQGDKVATATYHDKSVRVWDSKNGRLLVNISERVIPKHNTGLVWRNDHLFVICAGKIKQFDASTGSAVSEWQVPDTENYSCIALPKHGGFVVYSARRTVTFYDASTHAQLAVFQHPEDTSLTAFSKDDRFFAIGGLGGKISIKRLSCTTNDSAPSLQSPTRDSVPTASVPPLRDWVKVTLANSSWKDALRAADSGIPRVAVYQALCERLETIDCMSDAVDCLHQMTTELGGATALRGKLRKWVVEFRRRLFEKFEHLGDAAANAQHTEAISHFSTALSLNPPLPQAIATLTKRSGAYMAMKSWKQALDDADRVIALDPSSPRGYELKHTVSHNAGDYDSAIKAFEGMFSTIEQSTNPEVQRHGDQYVNPSNTQAAIRKIVQKIIRRLPRELINTTNGHLSNKAEQALAFESLPTFNELVSSMTRRIDYIRIKREVREYFRYVMLSHNPGDNEPSFQQVKHVSVYNLDPSPTHNKLQAFCKIVRDAGISWAWSDTCCIKRSDPSVMQEAAVTMFMWYERSVLTVIYLRGVNSSSRHGALSKSIWNTRGWPLQGYIAAKVVRFYTEDWTLYLDLQLPNHKDSPEVVSEMEQATGMPAEELKALRPGLTNIREKLRLASTRQTKLVEDSAYSLLGISAATGISVTYGEGAVGHLLADLLTRSGDVSILAWTGESSMFNSCLPAEFTVFNGPTSHIPSQIPDSEMEPIVTASHASPFGVDVAMKLYDHIRELPTPSFLDSQMTLPCIAIRLPRLSSSRAGRACGYRADTDAFGMVTIRTRQNLSRAGTLYLVHPWLKALLEPEDARDGALEEDNTTLVGPMDADAEETSEEETEDECRLLSPLPEVSYPEAGQMDDEMRARWFVARLRQPFGALLLAPTGGGRGAAGYKRVAADAAVSVRFREAFALADILDAVRTFDIS